MTIAVEKLPDCKARLDIEIPAGNVESQRSELVSAFTAQAKVPGYRPGKTPKSVIEKRYAKQITEELQSRLLQQALQEASEKEGLEILGIGEIERQLFTADGAYSLSAEVVIAPEFSLPDYKGIEVNAPKIEIDDEQVDSVLKRMQANFAEEEDITDRPVAAGDVAILSWTSTLDGKPLKEALGIPESAEVEAAEEPETETEEEHVHGPDCDHDHDHDHNHDHSEEADASGDSAEAEGDEKADPGTELIDFLAHREESGLQIPPDDHDEEDIFFLPGFDDQVKGLGIGESRDVTVTIPDDFEAETLRERELVFNVTLKGIKKANLPEIDDELASKVEPGSTLSKLRENIHQGLEREQENARREMITNQIIGAISGEVEFDLPQHLVFNETQRQVNDLVYQSYQRGAGESDIEEHQEQIFQNAQSRAQMNLKANFILEEIAKAEEITVTNEEMSRHVAIMAAQSGKPVKKVISQLKKSDGFGGIRHDLLIGKVLEFLRSNASVKEAEPEEAADPAGAPASK